MITHDKGDAIPPVNQQLWIVEWMSKRPGQAPTRKLLMIPPGMPVSDNLRDEYWCARKMHGEFAAACIRNGVALPALFMIVTARELIGFGTYASADAHYRAFVDCMIREAEWGFRGRKEVPMIGMNMSVIPDAELTVLQHRTGAPVMGVGERARWGRKQTNKRRSSACGFGG
jgi:hypothetical protein